MSTLLRRSSRKPTLRGDSLNVPSPSSPVVGSNQTQSVGGAPTVTHSEGDPTAQNDATTSPPINTVIDLNQFDGPVAGQREAGVAPKDPVKPEMKPDNAPGAGFGSNPQAPDNPTDNGQAKFTPAKSSRVWDTYLNKAEDEVRDLVEDWDRVIDVTLVFAALFSAISTGFVLESSKNLQADQSKETILAIRDLTNVIQAGFNSSTGAAPSIISTPSSSDAPFQPSLATVWVNCLWFLSLGLSISVSLLAMLAKRWCYLFSRGSRRSLTSYERAIAHQRAWHAIEQWKMELVIEQLPTLMHIALMLFFIGLVVYLSEIHQTTMIVTAALVGITLAIYWFLTVLPAWFPTCPMVTPFTRATTHSTQTITYLTQTILACFPHLADLRDPARLITRVRDALESFSGSITALFEKMRQSIANFSGLLIKGQRLTPSSPSKEWLISGRREPAGTTRPIPSSPEDHQPALRVLVWILTHSKDRKTIQEVLEHITSFPDVVLNGSDVSGQLYTAISAVVDNLNQFQRDESEGDRSPHFDSLCARLFYLARLPWLHQSTEGGSSNDKIFSLIYGMWSGSTTFDYFMPQEELEKQTAIIKKKQLTKSTEVVSWMEGLARRIALNCYPEEGLKICSALGKLVLLQGTPSQPPGAGANTHRALWWIFLNCVMDCTNSAWPNDSNEELPIQSNITVTSNSALTLVHFRDFKTRREHVVWLNIVGISGMLYAFTLFPDHEDGPSSDSNKEYFTKLIGLLRSALYNPVTGSSDPFVGELPVYHETEVRLYEFDALHYAVDALHCAIKSPVYGEITLQNDLRSLLSDISQLKDIRQLFSPGSNKDPDYALIEKSYNDSIHANFPSGIWSASGLLRDRPWPMNRERAVLLSKLLPAIIFGTPVSSGPSGNQDRPMITSDLDNYAELCDEIASLAWMPFGYVGSVSGAVLKPKNSNYPRHNVLWEPLCNFGLLRREIYRSYWYDDQEARALGYCLHIKASLLERLYSFPQADSNSPNILEWSIALSKQVAELLSCWEKAGMDADDQAFIITSLVKLANTLSEVASHSTLEATAPADRVEPTSQSNSKDVEDARTQRKVLVESGILPILARPFSKASSIGASERIPADARHVWHDDLATAIDRLAREFPPPDPGPSSGNSNNTEKRPSNGFYSDMVEYYEDRLRAEGGSPSPTLELVKRLRDDMKAHDVV